METANQRNKRALVSMALLTVGWVCTAAFLKSGMELRYQAGWWVQTIDFCCYMFAPVAGLLALAGLWFGNRKRLPSIALTLSIISTIVIVWIRP